MSISANELRLGNLVYATQLSGEVLLPVTVPLQILSIGLFEVQALSLKKHPAQEEQWPQYRLQQIEPIPLDEDWLKRFGFEEARQ